MNVQIVKGELARLEDYCDVFLKSPLYDHYYKGNNHLSETLADAINKNQLYVALTSKGEAVGVMRMAMCGAFDLPYLNLLGVKDSYRGMGVGSTLIDLFIGVAEGAGFPNMFILTSEFNVRAKKLYQSKGFKKYCLLPSLLRPDVNEFMFMRPSQRKTAC